MGVVRQEAEAAAPRQGRPCRGPPPHQIVAGPAHAASAAERRRASIRVTGDSRGSGKHSAGQEAVVAGVAAVVPQVLYVPAHPVHPAVLLPQPVAAMPPAPAPAPAPVPVFVVVHPPPPQLPLPVREHVKKMAAYKQLVAAGWCRFAAYWAA
ncbi:unnamed protein product [Vitrella brassicaformis CCMP3155]|uniref:Uncharacterized protein n=1 Tax=Vitrella brassicaformis (strain CCMP3155) TaxID=1169540 RepID=A0A0G4FY74_VITBC|nr:unnamed protein product [Vitrella brassicaformis CCMP3155]|eukprot:CEM20392.1 unnamed protein product [Vitrella brassicaformis CCMP3155]